MTQIMNGLLTNKLLVILTSTTLKNTAQAISISGCFVLSMIVLMYLLGLVQLVEFHTWSLLVGYSIAFVHSF